MSERRYSDAEVAAILSRAADLSAAQTPSATSLIELERIGNEAGLPPELIRQAAAELGRGGRQAEEAQSFWGKVFGRLRLKHETVVPGEIDEDGREALLDTIQEELGIPGSLSRAGRSMVWSSTSGPQGGRAVTVHVSSRNGQTTVRVEESLGNLLGGIWGGVMGGGGSGLAAMFAVAAGVASLGPAGVVLGIASGLGLGFGLSRGILARATDAREEQLKALFSGVVATVSEHARLEAQEGSALEAARARHGILPAAEGDVVPVGERADEVEAAAVHVDSERQRSR